MNFEEWFLSRSLKEQVMIFSSFVFILGLAVGALAGEKIQAGYIKTIMIESAHTNQLIRSDDLYFHITPYNLTGCENNISCLKGILNATETNGVTHGNSTWP